MTTSEPNLGERVKDVRCANERLFVDLVDGRTIAVPLAWYPKLQRATAAQRAKWTICGGGFGVHWSEIDEDLSAQGLLRGAKAPGSSRNAAA